ncbi:hypothetical protein [Bacillus cereus group sp. N24]|uniref:hypothetical protein n=1 Tax=Bacillus cereus group sp. N24 TaxID=2794592 RepID=UPI0018F57B3E|nr:hypothetical protein [Bacillus cereus group sp. N24]MBJ7950102.1 hypothetical protein [Bacillus cereus group sp. N24]
MEKPNLNQEQEKEVTEQADFFCEESSNCIPVKDHMGTFQYHPRTGEITFYTCGCLMS